MEKVLHFMKDVHVEEIRSVLTILAVKLYAHYLVSIILGSKISLGLDAFVICHPCSFPSTLNSKFSKNEILKRLHCVQPCLLVHLSLLQITFRLEHRVNAFYVQAANIGRVIVTSQITLKR